METNFFMTPGKLKIRLNENFCRNLPIEGKTLEEIGKEIELYVVLMKWMVFVGGIISFFVVSNKYLLLIIPASIVCLYNISCWCRPLFTVFRNTIYWTQPKIFLFIGTWQIYKILLIIIGFFTAGWLGLLFFFIGYLGFTFLNYIIGVFVARHLFKKNGFAIQSDENVFIFLTLRRMKKYSYNQWLENYKLYLKINS